MKCRNLNTRDFEKVVNYGRLGYILIKAVLLYFLVLFLARVMGRKHPAKVTSFNFINYSVIAVITAMLVLNLQINLAFGLVALAVWTLFPVAVDFLALRSKLFHDLMYGRKAVLIKRARSWKTTSGNSVLRPKNCSRISGPKMFSMLPMWNSRLWKPEMRKG